MSDPVILWARVTERGVFVNPERSYRHNVEYTALPSSEFDAMIRERDSLLHTSDKQTVAWKGRAMLAEAEVGVLRSLLVEARGLIVRTRADYSCTGRFDQLLASIDKALGTEEQK